MDKAPQLQPAGPRVTELGDLRLTTLGPVSDGSKASVLILGNAYGVLPYQRAVAGALAERGYEATWFPFSGQDDAPGSYSLRAGVAGIASAVGWATETAGGKDIFMLAHCAGSLMALEYLRTHQHAPIRRLAVYGLLFSPARRRQFAEERFRELGVRHSIREEDWNYDPVAAVADVEVPILFCHSHDELNKARATQEEVRRVAVAAPHGVERWFTCGYDSDRSYMISFVNAYEEWFDHGNARE